MTTKIGGDFLLRATNPNLGLVGLGTLAQFMGEVTSKHPEMVTMLFPEQGENRLYLFSVGMGWFETFEVFHRERLNGGVPVLTSSTMLYVEEDCPYVLLSFKEEL